jgi:TonB family protein
MRTNSLQIIGALLLAVTLADRAQILAQNAAPAQPQSAPDADAGPAVPPCATTPLRRVGGTVSPPLALFAPAPKFSDEARAAKFSGGTVLVNLTLDVCGRPQNVHVLHGVGMGLDENAVAAVKQYIFKPAMENGQPVPVEVNIQVNFQVYPLATVKHSVPIVLTDEARQNNASGTIVVGLTVDEQGMPQDVHILRGFGMGMDEQAVAAVKQYTFEPFRQNDKPVAQQALVEVKFPAD